MSRNLQKYFGKSQNNCIIECISRFCVSMRVKSYFLTIAIIAILTGCGIQPLISVYPNSLVVSTYADIVFRSSTGAEGVISPGDKPTQLTEGDSIDVGDNGGEAWLYTGCGIIRIFRDSQINQVELINENYEQVNLTDVCNFMLRSGATFGIGDNTTSPASSVVVNSAEEFLRYKVRINTRWVTLTDN